MERYYIDSALTIISLFYEANSADDYDKNPTETVYLRFGR